MPTPWPPTTIPNEPGIATFSLGNSQYHKLRTRLEEAAKAGYKQIDLFDECWAAYLEEHGLPGAQLWDATAENLAVAQKLGNLVNSLGMRIACTQPARNIEGIKDAAERRAALDLVAQRFPFMRAFDTDLVFLCASIRKDPGVTSDLKTVARDLAELGDMAKTYSDTDGGRPLRIGYEGLSWATRNTWSSTWEAVRMANRPNVGLVLDAFNILAVEFADPYNPAGHGRVYSTLGESIDVLCASMAALVATVPGDRIFFFQVADAERVDPVAFRRPTDANVPALMPWSRAHRLYPFEESRGGYMPVQLVAAAVVATGYQGPMSLEVFNSSLIQPESDVPAGHARRGIEGLRKLAGAIQEVPPFWEMWQQGCRQFGQITSSMRPERL
ncbi:sugar phosphate isomerase [Aspergillus campestris IBT 28561]|uniref:Sugar phosphate isomerase n=1 Tax=Aspergillus campestris (strain IBT 28561) TaxID=1392248 RepID=A0A2I1D1K5_ASPC2|nr:sugar phosphate isomerase [Aspergillus campestris IBT 28561]PKY03738.1 sugar phosphate isomerase [Aspergillus campestris IBT 28561]